MEFLRSSRRDLIQRGIEGHCTILYHPRDAAEIEIRTGCSLAELSESLGVTLCVDDDAFYARSD